MKQTTLIRYVIGAALVLTLVTSCTLSSNGASVGYRSVNGYTSYGASSDPALLLISPLLIVLYLWVMRSPTVGGRNFVVAGIWRRFWSFLVDFLFAMFVVAPWMGLVALLVEAGHTGHFEWVVQRQPAQDGDGSLASLLLLPGMVLLLSYFVLPLSLGRATPGSVLLGIEVRTDSGKPLPFLTALGRTVLSYLAVCGCFISIPMALCDPEKRMWQDKACDTRVVQWTD
ncbi:MAG TPA: RDD family protein [Gammaproteobacteria bacterium]|jgi:uncharacterized RDD family membrane protein YckC